MIEHILRYTLPAAYALLPPAMDSQAATAMLLAIGLQESNFTHRRQSSNGPARGFLMFERGEVRPDRNTGGLAGVLAHKASAPHMRRVLEALQYPNNLPLAEALRLLHEAVAHNDTLCFAAGRLLLWTLPRALPTQGNAAEAWDQYLAAWNPGAARKNPKPHLKRWMQNFPAAWDLVVRHNATEDIAAS